MPPTPMLASRSRLPPAVCAKSDESVSECRAAPLAAALSMNDRREQRGRAMVVFMVESPGAQGRLNGRRRRFEWGLVF